jgi:hypothetical protein
MPAEYLPVLATEIDIYKAMEAAGYWRLAKLGNASDYETEFEILIFTHHEGRHLFVELWSGDYQACEFFVGMENRAPFMVEALPKLMHPLLSAEFAREMRAIRKTLVAFVRHGQGTDTISEEGDWTLDEERQEQRNRRAAAQRKAEAAAKAAGSVP